MPSRFASGKAAIAHCDVCGFRYKLVQLKPLVIKTKNTNILACPECWNEDHPQLSLGLYPVNDPQAVRNPRPDTSYYTPAGANGGDGGSRVIQWGWNPVGFNTSFLAPNTPNDLIAHGAVGTVAAVVTEATNVPVTVPVTAVQITTYVAPVAAFQCQDYIIIQFKWGSSNGTDLETRVGLYATIPAYDGQYVGGGLYTTVPVGSTQANSYLAWAGDFTGSSGEEDSLITLKNIIAAYPSLTKVTAEIRAYWKGVRGNGNVLIDFLSYVGGGISKIGTTYVNSGGTLYNSNSHTGNVGSTPGNGDLLATIEYDKATNLVTWYPVP